MKRILVMLLVFGVAPAAQAQEQTEFERYALAIAGACLNSESTPEAAPAAVTVCEKMVTDIDTLKSAVPDVAGHDLNVYHIVRGMGLSRVAASYGRIDGVRSARVCQRTEDAWRHTSQVVAASSPTYTDTIRTLVTSTTDAITKCRSEFGTPAGAPPLP
jgi:hypothetical protein